MSRAPIALCLIKEHPPSRRQAVEQGLRALGYDLIFKPQLKPHKDDILVVWNRMYNYEFLCQHYVKNGCKVLVLENGYIGVDRKGVQLYALALYHHNGCGDWHVGQEDRWSRLKIDVKPWRTDGDHILVLPQRGIGERGVAMPSNWISTATKKLALVTKRPVVVKGHPGSKAATRTMQQLEPYLENCWAVVTWGSGAGIKAITQGIPVFHELPKWIGAPAAKFGIRKLEEPYLGDRSEMFHKLSWSQWTLDEISTGAPFQCLLKL